jgi:hypothetical protein
MRTSRQFFRALPLGVALVLAACAGSERRTERPVPPPEPEPVVEAPPPMEEPTGPIVPEESSAPEGPVCTRTSECESGLACRGVSGCTSDWACAAPIACGSERVSYCDCEGVTFYAQSGCPGRTYAHVGPCADTGIAETSLGLPDGDEPITSEDRTCESSADCPRWQICFGVTGCGTDWRCERVRGCSRHRVAFCGCDGETFMASEDCPGQAFLRRGACDEAIASTLPETPLRPPTPSTPTPTTVASTPSPGGCTSSRDCRAGRVCTGPPGCGMVWTCERPPEPCNPDTQVFCDCEGETFRASMTCPGRPHAHRGSCAMDQMLDLSGAALR